MSRAREPFEVTVEDAAGADAEALSLLHGAAMLPQGEEAWSAASIARLIASPAALCLIARPETGGAPVGMVLAFAAVDEAEILTLCVAPDWQRRGIARQLLRTLERRLLVVHGTRHLHLDVRASSDAARALYRVTGFIETVRRKGYYTSPDGGPAEDAVLMVKELQLMDEAQLR